MKWPFVPRSLFDETVSDLRARLDASDKDRRKLTRTIVKMKVAGGTIPRALDGTRFEQRPRDEVEKAVDQNPFCQANPALRRQQIAWARKAIAEGMDEQDVIGRIGNFGQITDDVEDDEETAA